MSSIRKTLTLIVILSFVSCTDNTEIKEQQNVKVEILGSNKNNDTSPNSGGGDTPENGEG